MLTQGCKCPLRFLWKYCICWVSVTGKVTNCWCACSSGICFRLTSHVVFNFWAKRWLPVCSLFLHGFTWMLSVVCFVHLVVCSWRLAGHQSGRSETQKLRSSWCWWLRNKRSSSLTQSSFRLQMVQIFTFPSGGIVLTLVNLWLFI